MKKVIISLLSLTCLNLHSMTCHKEDVTLEVVENNVTIKYYDQELHLTIDNQVWDGHIAGLMTGHSFAISYENHYGCLRNVRYTGPVFERSRNILSIDFGTCAGGSTSDDLCLRN